MVFNKKTGVKYCVNLQVGFGDNIIGLDCDAALVGKGGKNFEKTMDLVIANAKLFEKVMDLGEETRMALDTNIEYPKEIIEEGLETVEKDKIGGNPKIDMEKKQDLCEEYNQVLIEEEIKTDASQTSYIEYGFNRLFEMSDMYCVSQKNKEEKSENVERLHPPPP